MVKNNSKTTIKYFFKKLEELSEKQDITLTDKLSIVLEELHHLVPVDAAQILLLNEDKKLVTIVSQNLNKEIRNLEYHLGEGVVGTAVQSGEIYFTGDIKSNVWNKPVKPIYGNVGSFKEMASFVVGAFKKGAIVLTSKQKDWFTNQDIKSINLILPFLSVFIKDALKDRNHALEIVKGMYEGLEGKHREYAGHARKTQQYVINLFDVLKVDKSTKILEYEYYGKEGLDSFKERLKEGAFLHDIGKIEYMDEQIASKSTFDEKTNPFKNHPIYGYNILKSHGIIDPVYLNCALHHHQHFDGKGYPPVDQGTKIAPLKGRDIPFEARMLTLADVFDALTSDRPYRRAFSKDKAKEIMKEQREQFDPYMFPIFLEVI